MNNNLNFSVFEEKVSFLRDYISSEFQSGKELQIPLVILGDSGTGKLSALDLALSFTEFNPSNDQIISECADPSHVTEDTISKCKILVGYNTDDYLHLAQRMNATVVIFT